jgi:hypothetical protein
MKIAMLKKALWYALLTGVSAAMPEILAEFSKASALSEIPWMEILDAKGVVFLVAALGGLGIGGIKAGVQGRAVKS